MRLSWIFVAAAVLGLSSCTWRTHPQEEGNYALTVGTVNRDDCALAQNPGLLQVRDVQVDGDLVRLTSSLFTTQLIGKFLEVSERFTADGSQENVDATVSGQTCQLNLVTIHMDGTTASGPGGFDGTRFSGALSVRLQHDPPNACDCQLSMTYDAVRQP